jgi:hypothetical protein
MEHTDIDFTRVKNKIVEQAYASAHVLNEEQKHKLIQDKLNRAKAQHDELKKISFLWHTDR